MINQKEIQNSRYRLIKLGLCIIHRIPMGENKIMKQKL